MRLSVSASVIALTVSLSAVPARAEEWEATKTNCVGAYGALAQEAGSQAAWNPRIGGSTNLTTINWADRRLKLLNGAVATEAAARVVEDNFRQMLRKDRIDNVMKGTGVVIELSMRCDRTYGYSPSFVIPPRTN